MAKITKSKRNDPKERETVVIKTKDTKKIAADNNYRWWKAKSQQDLCSQVLETAAFLKENQQYRYRQAAIYARLYGNLPVFNFAGSSLNQINRGNNMPIDRPTMNIIQSCVDTKVSKLSQDRPRPTFLTDNGDYRERTLAKQMNSFIAGELYQTKAYRFGELLLRDAEILGTGCLKVVRTLDKRVGLERRLCTELLVDPSEAMYGEPRQLFELRLVDRSVLAEAFPAESAPISRAEQAYPDSSGEASQTISDQVMVVEAWRLPSSKDSNDGRHVIACTSGLLLDEEFTKQKFPFVFLDSSSRLLGFWGQGCPERLMGTQIEINKLLKTISDSINLVGVPRVFLEEGSKVSKASLNNQIGVIIPYRGIKPSYEVAPCVPAELYAQLQRLIEYGYQQEGVSQLNSSGLKPSGLNSGEAQRAYEDIQSDRFAALQKRYENAFVDLAYLIIDQAIDIAEEEGSYETVFPDKNGTKEINLPDIKRLKDDPFAIECFTANSLPRDPAGRAQKIIEYMQAGLYTPQEGRRLLGFSDTEQEDKLLTAAEERILQTMDNIVEHGKYLPPDPFMDLAQAETIVVQYYNLYIAAKLSEDKAQMLRDFFMQVQDMKAMASPPVPAVPGIDPQASPMPPAQSPMIPNAPGVPQ